MAVNKAQRDCNSVLVKHSLLITCIIKYFEQNLKQ